MCSSIVTNLELLLLLEANATASTIDDDGGVRARLSPLSTGILFLYNWDDTTIQCLQCVQTTCTQ
jgi:hypothetical protein